VWLHQAKEALKAEIYDVCILASYEAMLHSARALLIKDGFREKSHYCVVKYLAKAYGGRGKLSIKIIDTIDIYIEMRHNTAYGLEFEANRSDAQNAVNDAQTVLEAIKKLL
jgi:uncharacterized protein (UPF0332 family)